MKHLNLDYGNKGIIFTLDVVVAVLIFILLLSLSGYYISKSQELREVNLMILRTGSDIITALDNNNILSTMDLNTIETDKDILLPNNTEMKIILECEDSSGGSSGYLETPEIIPNKFVGSGKRFFIRESNNNCIAQFFIWKT